MPNIKSAIKRVSVIKTKTERNNMIKSGYKSAVKKFEQSLGNNNAEETKALFEPIKTKYLSINNKIDTIEGKTGE